jgi:membrane-bound lytic murein transglycosylase D
MKRLFALALTGLLPALPAGAAENAVTLEELLESGREWLEENVDPDVLESFGDLDEEQARRFLRDFQQRFAGEYVLDLAPLRATANAIVPVLEQFEATRGHAIWLRTRLDYFDVAEQLRLIIPEPEPEPGRPPPPRPNPTPEQERKVWRQTIATRPWPRGADAYVPRLKPVFAGQKLPPELVWLAEIESSFNPAARSPAGAAGLYQLMPATAKNLGLALAPTDERLDPEKNADAAARYLRYLHDRFKDWPLALAAYNCGEGRLQSLLTRHRARTFDQVATRLPAETQMYVPKMDAVLQRREGKSLEKLPPPL